MTNLMINFLNSNLLSDAMGSFGIGLLTLFIPLVIYLLQDGQRLEWDRIVILEKVIRAKTFAGAFSLVFLPLFLWHFDTLKLALLFSYGIGVYMISIILINSYRWIRTVDGGDVHRDKSIRNVLRKEYLSEKNDWLEKEKIWALTWKNQIESTVEERGLINTFSSHFDTLLSEDKLNIASSYIRSFASFIDLRPLHDWTIFRDLLSKLLSWDYYYYSKNDLMLNDKDGKYSVDISTSSTSVKQLIEKMTLVALQKGTAYIYFDSLRKHIEGKDKKYLEHLFVSSICKAFFDNIADSKDAHDIWGSFTGKGYFPPEWKITKETFEKRDFISMIWLDSFLHWAQPRIQEQYNDKKGFDKRLNEVSTYLFPTTDPILWAQFLTLLIKPWSGNRMQSFIEDGTVFGIASRMVTSIGSYGSIESASEQLHKRMEIDRETTMELALTMFPGDFSKEHLGKYVHELEAVQFENGSKNDLKKKGFLNVLKEMIATVKK